MKKTIGIFAHVDAGKTTLSEQILYNTGAIRTLGRVDTKNTVLDYDKIERKRGITIFSDVAEFKYGKSEYYLIDTPGHIDFCAETERALSVIDYAILVLSAVEGIQGHTVTLWRMLEAASVPVFIFINKTDRVGARPNEIISELKNKFSPDIIFKDEIIEKSAERDEELLNLYLADNFDNKLWTKKISELINNRRLFLCLCGSALNNIATDELLDIIEKYTYTDYDDNRNFSARAFKVKYDSKGIRNVFLKILSGHISPRDKIEENQVFEIRKFTGYKYKVSDVASAGTICAVTGLNNIRPGDILGENKSSIQLKTMPVLASKAVFSSSYSHHEILKILKKLEDEEPLLKAEWIEQTQEIRVHVTGVIQIEVLKEIINERFNISIDFGKCEVLYKETISESSIGSGHFEPLRHYAEVHLMISSQKRGSGISFESVCNTDILDKNYQNLIKTHIFEKVHKGILTGSPLTDVKFILLTGKAHLKHTQGGDFREAVYRAVRHGLYYAENILLEPIYNCTINIPQEYAGRIMSDIQRMSGTFDSPHSDGGFVKINAKIPVSEAMDYPKELQNSTRGRGQISMSFGGYDICHNTQEVIRRIGYDPESDIENTADSVFCSHGSGFNVKWNESRKYMHCLPD